MGKPKIAPKIPIAVPMLTNASERLSKAAALTAELFIFLIVPNYSDKRYT